MNILFWTVLSLFLMIVTGSILLAVSEGYHTQLLSLAIGVLIVGRLEVIYRYLKRRFDD